MEEKNKELLDMIEKLQNEMKGVKEIEKYAKKKLIIEEKEEKVKKENSFIRKMEIKSEDNDKSKNSFKIEIRIVYMNKP